MIKWLLISFLYCCAIGNSTSSPPPNTKNNVVGNTDSMILVWEELRSLRMQLNLIESRLRRVEFATPLLRSPSAGLRSPTISRDSQGYFPSQPSAFQQEEELPIINDVRPLEKEQSDSPSSQYSRSPRSIKRFF